MDGRFKKRGTPLSPRKHPASLQGRQRRAVPKAPSSEGVEVSFLRKRQSRKGISGLPLLGKRHPRGTAGTPRLRPRTLNQTFHLPRLTDERSPLSALRVRAFVLPKKADETSTLPARPTRRSLSQDFPYPLRRVMGGWGPGPREMRSRRSRCQELGVFGRSVPESGGRPWRRTEWFM